MITVAGVLRSASLRSTHPTDKPHPLFVEPNRGEVLVDVMARVDLPALHISAVGHDAVPPQQKDRMRLVVEDILLELPHQAALRGGVGLRDHLLVESDLVWIFVEAEILRLDRV